MKKNIVLFDNNILLLLQDSCRGIPADNLVHMLRPHRGGEIKRKRSVPPSGMALGEVVSGEVGESKDSARQDLRPRRDHGKGGPQEFTS